MPCERGTVGAVDHGAADVSWIGQTDLNFAAFDPAGLRPGANTFALADENAIMPVGTLVVETLFAPRPGRSQVLLHHERYRGWMRSLSLEVDRAGRLAIAVRQGGSRFRARVAIALPPAEATLRVSFAWDAPARRAWVSVENLDADLIHQVEAPAPIPLPLSDIREIVLNGPATRIPAQTRLVAFSDRIEPVGLPLGIVAGTPVMTPSGPRAVERLRLGDMVCTLSGNSRSVRWLARRQVPALGRFQPVRLRAPYFGLARDIFCAPDHRLVFSDPEAEYQLGESAVLVEAGHLVDGRAVRREWPDMPVLTYYHILLDQHDCVQHDGLWAESLFVGAIGRSPALMNTTTLAQMPFGAIPRHDRFALPILNRVQARALAHSITA